jgi:hypothetical protein
MAIKFTAMILDLPYGNDICPFKEKFCHSALLWHRLPIRAIGCIKEEIKFFYRECIFIMVLMVLCNLHV